MYPDTVKHPCDVICMFDEKGNVTPLKVRVDLGKRMPIVKVEKVLSREVREVVSKKFVEFRCVGAGKEFQLIFDVWECKWYVGK